MPKKQNSSSSAVYFKRAAALTVFCVEQHLVELGLIVIECPLDFVYRLLVSQVTVHEAGKQAGEKIETGGLMLFAEHAQRNTED